MPAEIGQLNNLTWLDLSENQLSNLPAEIGQLKNLTTLHLSSNQLSRLPAEIGQLKNKKYHLYRINGVEDHIHIVTHIHQTVAIASLVKDIKVASSGNI